MMLLVIPRFESIDAASESAFQPFISKIVTPLFYLHFLSL
jgi:hypothetical protein